MRYRKTLEEMSKLSWAYVGKEWYQVPAEEKAGVLSAFCKEAPYTEDYFTSRWTSSIFSEMFSQVQRSGGIYYLDRDTLQGFIVRLMVDVQANADSVLEGFFEGCKPSKKELDEAAEVERSELEG